ncbi:hypothetical protein J5N97_023353 [Dioscorea zingiberensis]|uniref:CAF1B/HIR1 beta-propeller domain-containing protein n=1 Tax=Dioscorea zingiberensis TaxID=325984 RepID=A0A9D5CBW6_9LILI|nr:hypothetical protein J5N97_023353 [Dioscorea zingiberensis]
MKGGTVQINWHDTQPVLSLDFHPHFGLLATGGEHLASGADGGELVIWKLHPSDDGYAWKVLKNLSFHRKDVLDIQWSYDGEYLVSFSVDNSCIIWDANKGQYVASLGSNRTCRVYVNKPQPKSKGYEKLNYVCQHVITKSELQKHEDTKPTSKSHLFHDETLPSFFRRLAWSPDGSFLLVPAGIYRDSSASDVLNTAYIFSRNDLSSFHFVLQLLCLEVFKLSMLPDVQVNSSNTAPNFTAVQLPGASKPVVVARFCPVVFHLRGSKSAGLFKLPYRVVFAVATFNSLYIYDTESAPPIAIFAGLHYAAVTDIAWSSDAKYIALSSRDGYCTVIEFENDELGMPFCLAETSKTANPPAVSKPELSNQMAMEKPEAPKDDEAADKKTNKGNHQSQSSTATKTSDTNKPARKRITPIAIN